MAVSELTMSTAALEDISRVEPFRQTPENFRYLFPIVLAVGIREEADDRTPSIMHHFFWPLWSNSPLYKIEDFEDSEKLLLWKCIEYIFVSDGMLADDPYWLENKDKLRRKVLDA